MMVKPVIPCEAFDVNQPLTHGQASAFKANGYDACIRYLPRTPDLVRGNLTAQEMQILLSANLAVGFVQHVALPGWNPTAALGHQYGSYCAEYAQSIDIPPGPVLWCDLEEVAPGTTAQAVIEYVSSWAAAVTAAGYLAGLYVGWNVVLSDRQLYDLPVKNYWRSYNCDQSIPTRGFQMVQHTQKTLNGIDYDPNIIQEDNLGELPVFIFPG